VNERECPTCKQPKGQRCRAGSGRPTETHQSRYFGVRVSRQSDLRPARKR
jgi:hypothetical protein